MKAPKKLLEVTKKEVKPKKEPTSKISTLKNKVNTIYRYNKYKLYLTFNKKYPKSSQFYNEVFRKFKGKYKVHLVWMPGMSWIGPITLALRLKATERVFRDLESRNIFLDDIRKSEDATLEILNAGVFYSMKPKSKLYKDYLDKIEAKVRKE
ncbi:MAG: hypothetical protein WCF78_00650 [archaeon]